MFFHLWETLLQITSYILYLIIQNVIADFKSCSHNSKFDRTMLKVAVIIRNVTVKC